ncbi:MAG: transposase [Propionibacteriaceae bacterium]
MAKGYRRLDRGQQFLLPPDMGEWLPASDPVWLVIEVIGACDTSAFHAGRRLGGAGRAGFDPDMLLTLLVWAWLQGVHSSRRIERLCSRDIAFRVICAGDVPDHVTIARFRQGSAAGVEQLFEQVLVLASRLGLGQLGVVALDGTKISSPASSGQNRTEDGLMKAAAAEQAAGEQTARAREAARRAAAAHAAADADEDARFGSGHGDQLSDEPVEDGPVEDGGGDQPGTSMSRRPGRSRSVRIAEALADLAKQAARDEAGQQERAAKRAARVAGNGNGNGLVGGRPPTGTEVVAAERALDAARSAAGARLEQWQATGRGARPPEVDDHWLVRKETARLVRAHRIVARRAARGPRREPVRNITDPESRPQPLAGGSWLQGYNAQAVTTDDGLILATDVSSNSGDATTFLPMMKAATEMAERVGAGPIGLVLADAGYLSVDNLTGPGPDRLIAVGTRRSLEAAAHSSESEQGGGRGVDPAVQAMRDRLATPEGINAYRQRGRIAETTFGQAKHNLGFRQFTGIGLDRARTEWMFHAVVHNLSKIITHRQALAPTTG